MKFAFGGRLGRLLKRYLLNNVITQKTEAPFSSGFPAIFLLESAHPGLDFYSKVLT